MLNIYSTLITSIIVQIITGVIEISALFIKVPERKHFLKQMMLLEVIVQIIEGIFYFVWFLHFKRIKNITPSRYFDWAITTPTMLINLIFYLIFLQDNNVHFFELFKKEFYTIITVLLLNWMMLFFGYLGEIHKTPVTGVLLGFIPFLLYYYIIYKKYAIGKGVRLFFYFFIVWCFYGIVALFSYKIKNMCYNVLDLFSKNFFGLFLTYLIFKG